MFVGFFFLLQVPLLAWAAQVSQTDAKGVLLLDSISYPIIMDELNPETRILIGIFSKKQTLLEEPLSLEGEVRNNYLNFVSAYAKDEGTDLSHLMFAQIIVNG
jgi:hypothetical protein